MLRNRTVVFAGDLVMRDLWTAAGVHLLKAEGFDAQKMAGELACMVSSWRFVDLIGIRDELLERNSLHERENVLALRVCGGARLVFRQATDGDAVVREVRRVRAAALVVSHGVEQLMESVDVPKLEAWARAFDPRTTVYVGMHAVKSPRPPNARIREWTAAVGRHSSLKVVDPYWLTESLREGYRDTDDGLHYGYWVNLQKFQLVLAELG